MSALLSVLVNKDLSASSISLYLADPKTIHAVMHGCDKGCSAFIETIADLDNAHFMTKFEMQDLASKLLGVKYNYPPRDRLVAAKELSRALAARQQDLPRADKTFVAPSHPTKTFPPQAIITPCKKGTKLALLVELLRKGSTFEELLTKMGQKAGGVLSSLNWDLQRRKGIGYKVTTINGVDHYSLLLPQGFAGQLIV